MKCLEPGAQSLVFLSAGKSKVEIERVWSECLVWPVLSCRAEHLLGSVCLSLLSDPIRSSSSDTAGAEWLLLFRSLGVSAHRVRMRGCPCGTAGRYVRCDAGLDLKHDDASLWTLAGGQMSRLPDLWMISLFRPKPRCPSVRCDVLVPAKSFHVHMLGPIPVSKISPCCIHAPAATAYALSVSGRCGACVRHGALRALGR